jgi:hypothetical protein
MNLVIKKEDVENNLPKIIYLSTSNGNFELEFGTVQIVPSVIQIMYSHSTPIHTDDVLTDGEPDYLGIDIHLNKKKNLSAIVDITYGDAVKSSFEIMDGKIEVGGYEGYGSKFDRETEFFFQEKTLEDFIKFFEHLGFKTERKSWNFLDGEKNSFKMEKVRYISDFRTFNLRARL